MTKGSKALVATARRCFALLAILAGLTLPGSAPVAAPPADYFSRQGQADVLAGGVRMIEIATPSGKYRVWTRRVGNNPKLKLLLLHGGPGLTHDYFAPFDSYLPAEGIEYYYYDQLGSGRSDRPDDPSLWTTARFVDEVEQVRTALGLGLDDFCLLGHSWGGILAIEYALAHPKALKCLVISNMMDSGPAYNAYAHKVLMPAMDPAKLAEVEALEKAGKTEDPRYMQLLLPTHYEQHFLRMPFAAWPEPVLYAMEHMNKQIYTLMQGPSELGLSGRLERWDRSADLARIRVPTLVIGAAYDTMDPAYMRAMAQYLPKGVSLDLPDGSHMAMYDDQARYFDGLIAFLKQVEVGRR